MRGRLTAWAAVAVGVGFLATEAIVLNAHIRDYDEGVYWQSLRAMARSEPLFRSVFASQPPIFYEVLLPFYWLGHSLISLRLTVLMLGIIGLAATYAVGRLLSGHVAGLVAVVLTATSPLYLHQSAIVQADGPAVAIGMVAVALALGAVRADGRWRDALAIATGLALSLSIGTKLLGVVALIPIALVILGAPRRRGQLMVGAIAGGVLGMVLVLLPAVGLPRAAYDQLVLSHLRAGASTQGDLGGNLKILLLHREVPLEMLAAVGVVLAAWRRDRAIIMPLAWTAASVLAVLFYHPLFAHHLVMLSLTLALVAAVGLRHLRALRRGNLVVAGFVVATASVGAYVAFHDIQLALTPDHHDAEMTAAVQAASRPGEYWISDNPFAVAAADRDIPGPLVDTSGQRTRSGLLTVGDLEATRVRYDIRWLLEDSFRLEAVPGFRGWRDQHFHAVKTLGGGAVIYQR